MAKDHDLNWKFEKKFNAEVAREGDTIYAKPQTYMNNCGDTVSKLVNYYEIDTREDLLVTHDDLDLDFGVVKKQFGKGSAGHKGVEDIVSKLGTQDFWRIRIGIGRPVDSKILTDDWVLMNFEKSELESLQQLNIDL